MNEILIKYITDILRNPIGAKIKLDDLESGSERDLGEGIEFLHQQIKEAYLYSMEISNGNFNAQPPGRVNPFVGPLKDINSNIKHLGFQMKQVAKGDYEVELDYFRDVGESFNDMVNEIAKRERRLVNYNNDKKMMIDTLQKMERISVCESQDVLLSDFKKICQNEGITFMSDISPEEFPLDKMVMNEVMTKMMNISIFIQSYSILNKKKVIALTINIEREWFILNLEFTYDGIMQLDRIAPNPAPSIILDEIDQVSNTIEDNRGVFDYEADPDSCRITFEIRMKDRKNK